MTMKAHNKQRDMVRLALLVCGDRPSEKYRAPAKGTQSSTSVDSTLRYFR
jgi:hypothetical protein